MPTLVWLYLTALRYYGTSANCVALAEALAPVSHDRLTRLLQGDGSGQRLLELAWRTLFVWDKGDLIIDATVLPKPFAPALEGLAWGFSSVERQPVYGRSLVRLVWTHGTRRIPLGRRLWHEGGPSQHELALALRSYARKRLRCRPESVLCDAWYPSKALRKRIRNSGWSVGCRRQKNRRFNGHAVRYHRRHPYGAECGWLTGGLKVLVVRYGTKDDATHRLTLTALEVRRLYQVRAHMEEVLRGCKDQRGLTGGQARSERAQRHHRACRLAAVCVLERARHDRHLSIDQLKRQRSYRGLSVALPTLERLKRAA